MATPWKPYETASQADNIIGRWDEGNGRYRIAGLVWVEHRKDPAATREHSSYGAGWVDDRNGYPSDPPDEWCYPDEYEEGQP